MSDVVINQENVKYILMDGFKYSFNRMLGSAQKWKCTNKSCYAYFKLLDNQILPGVMAHTHQREADDAIVAENEGITYEEQKVEPPVEQKTERPGGTRTYPSKAKRGQVKSSWHLPDDSGNVAKKPKPSSSGTKSTVMRQGPRNLGSPPDSGFVSDQDSSSFQLAAVRSGTASPAKTPLLLAAPRSGTASPAVSSSPPKSPKLSEMGPPPTPPLSQHSSQHDSDPSSPLPPIYDLLEPKYQPSFSPDFSAYFMQQRPNSPVDNSPSTKSSVASSSRTVPTTMSSERHKKLTKLAKFNDFKKSIMKLDNKAFGNAVSSLLSELPSKEAEDMRYEVATLLFDAVEENDEKKTSK